MENVFQDPVQLSKGINLKELMTTATEFHIDMDFKKKQNGMSINMDDDFFPDMDDDDSDEEDVLKNIEDSADKLMLSSPEYLSFDELAKKMVDCIPSGDVKILIIEEGSGPLVPVDAEVTLHYAAYWEKSNIPFDSTLTMNGGTPLTLRLGKRRILPGLELGLTTVRGPRARCHLLLAPSAAWGPRGAPPRIRPERALFVISLYSVSDVRAGDRELMTTATEFHIDMDFKKKQNGMSINMDDDFFPDMDDDDSDEEDVLKNIEDSADKLMLSSPEYLSFDELAKKMVDCIPSGDVKILIIEEGSGPLVPVDAEVTLHYAAYWEKSNIPFDSTLTMNGGTPLTLRLGKRRILPGLELGLTTVRGPRARCHLLLAPSAAWGPRGAPPRIRPERALFVISLYSVSDVRAGDRFNDLPMEEQTKFEVTMRTVNGLHTEAKDLFTKKRYKRAIKNYQQSMSVLGLSRAKNEEEEKEIKKLKITVYVNLALCYCKIDKPKYALIMCENIDRISNLDNHCKGLFYYGRAHQMLGKHEDALVYYKKALKLEPKNKDIGIALAGLDKYLKSSAVKEKEIWQNAFQSTPEEKKEKVVYAVDEDFQNGVREMCKDLADRNEYAKFDLPTGLTKDEVDCIKSLANDFKGLVVQEDGEGKRKKVSIIKKMST